MGVNPLRGRKQVLEEVDAELGLHLELRAAELERRGMSPEGAWAEALRRFGDLEATRSVCYESSLRREDRMRRREYLGELRQDLVVAQRQLRRRPGFTAVTILTLAVGIGANTAIFSAADHVLLRPLPYAEPDRIMTLWEVDGRTGEQKREVSAGNFLDWSERGSSFERLALAEPFGFDLTGVTPPEPVNAWLVTEGFLGALGVRPVLGRDFLPEEYEAGGPVAVLLTHGFWRNRYGSDPSVVGGAIELDGRSVLVAGVLPPGLVYPSERGVWAPKVFRPEEANDRRASYMTAVGRLRQGVTVEQARADLGRVAAALEVEHPATNTQVGVNLVPLEEHVLGGVRAALLVLLGAVGLLLLIGCANVAGLVLARGAERGRELAVRAAMGAGRGRLMRQLVTESLVLGVLGGAAGLALAWLGVGTLTALSPAELPRMDTVGVDGRVLVYAAAVSLLTVLLFGLAPAVRFSRPDLHAAFKSGGRALRGGWDRARWRGVLVVSEIALALVLLIGAGLLVRSFATLLSNELGFAAEDRATVQAFLWDRNPTAQQRIDRVNLILERFEATPGVLAAGAVSALPFHPSAVDAQTVLRIEDRPAPPPGAEARAFTTVATPRYFEVMDIRLRRGRAFGEADRLDSPPVAIVNEALVRRHFPDEDPIGRRITIGVMAGPVTREIVGVVGNVRPSTLDSDPRPEVYVPHAQSAYGGMTFVVRTRGDAAAILPSLQAAIGSIDPEQTIYHAATVESLVSATLAERRFHLALLGLFSAVALALAAIGTYGLLSFWTAQRTGEIGVRMALGAARGHIVRMILGQAMRLAVPGVLLGLAGAAGLSRFMEHMLYGVAPADPWTYAQIAALMVAVAAVAAYVPARRAVRADPMAALRSE